LCKAPLPPHTRGTNDPDCLGLILWPVDGPQPSPRVTGGPGCAGSSLWIFLAMAGVFAVPGAGILCTGAPVCFPPPLVGVELEHKCGSCRFLQALL
jgi:hypothetical protein